MPRYIAFLRGVSPMNAKMPELRRSFEEAGFTNVKTVLASGNVAFDARAAIVPTLEKKAEAAMQSALGRSFLTIVRPAAFLQSLVEADPFAAFDLPAKSKRIVTFLRRPYEGAVQLPIERDQASILQLQGTELYSAYVPTDKGPVFMAILERTFGPDITTRSFDTVRKCALA